MDALATYILGAMLAWVPAEKQFVRENGKLVPEDKTQVMARYNSIAEDISFIAQDVDELPLFAGATGREKTALLLASVSSYEGGYQKVVDDGECNDPSYQPDGRGTCDNRSSWTIYQIKPYTGLMLTDRWVTQSIYNQERAKDHPEEVWTGKRLIADRRMATKVALHLMRYSYDNYKDLCGYTGECKQATHPLAANRQGRAVAYFAAHPFAIPKETAKEE